MDKTIIIVAGGSGSRMGSDLPKQFMLLNGKPLLMHTIDKFTSAIPTIHIVLVLPENQFSYWEELKVKHAFHSVIQVVKGGKSRFESVKNAMIMIKGERIVGIHDAVRPLISVNTIVRLFEEAEKKGNAVPFVLCKDSLRLVTGEENRAVARENYVLIQTPQVFQYSLIQKGYEGEEQSSFTDDASVYEYLGGKINLVKGDEQNIKITYPSDISIAEVWMNTSST